MDPRGRRVIVVTIVRARWKRSQDHMLKDIVGYRDANGWLPLGDATMAVHGRGNERADVVEKIRRTTGQTHKM
eukprot:scaffold4623_cov171-Amphora_coffeaeformis.AAC.2